MSNPRHLPGAASEYRETRELLQNYTPRRSAKTSMLKRQNVWRQIGTGVEHATSGKSSSALFRPAGVGFAAGVLIFALLFGIYLVANRSSPASNCR
jgi:hypothetical protein